MIEIVAPFSGGIGYIEKTCYGNNAREKIDAYDIIIKLSYINPTGDYIVAPADGTILRISIEADEFLILLENGIKMLVQFDTNVVQGEPEAGFIRLVPGGQRVRKGQRIIRILPGYFDGIQVSRYSTLTVYEPLLVWHVVSHEKDVVAGETVILYLDLEDPRYRVRLPRLHSIFDFDRLRTQFYLGHH